MLYRSLSLSLSQQSTVLCEHDQRQSVQSHLVGLLHGTIALRRQRDHRRAVPSQVPERRESQSAIEAAATSHRQKLPLRLCAQLRHPDGTNNAENVICILPFRELFCNSKVFVFFLSFFRATGSFCVKDSRVPFCPKKENDIGDRRCCLESPEWAELI